MRPLTDGCHKTLLPVNGVTLIGSLLATLESAGIRKVLIVTGYDAERVEQHVRERFDHLALRFVHNEQYDVTNNIVSLAIAFEHLTLEEELLLIEADLVMDAVILQRLITSPHAEAALLDRHRPGMDGTVVTVEAGVVTSVIPPHQQGADFNFSEKYKTLNVYKFSANFCQRVFAGLLRYYAGAVDGTCYYELILGILIYLKQVRIHAVMVEAGERWAELDDPVDLRVARWIFEPKDRRRILEETMGGFWAFDVLDFCFLRNMHFPPPAMLGELRRNLPALLYNYGSVQAVLDEKLAWWLLCQPGRATAVNGLSQVYPWLSRRLKNRRILLPNPTFGEYARGFPLHATYPDNFAINLQDVERKLRDADICIVVSPNNPTGTEVDIGALFDLIERHPTKLFLVDESFQGFNTQLSLVSWLEKTPLPNVLVLASLSKTMGVPGIRLGYVYTCDPTWRQALLEELPIWNLNAVAEALLELSLKFRNEWRASLQTTRHDRAVFADELRACPVVEKVVEGGGNFVVAAMKEAATPPGGFAEWLLQEHNIYVKDISRRINDGRAWLRLAVRLPEENRQLVEALHVVPCSGMCLNFGTASV